MSKQIRDTEDVLVRVFYMEIIGRGIVREGHVALGFASCYMTFENFPEPNDFHRTQTNLVH